MPRPLHPDEIKVKVLQHRDFLKAEPRVTTVRRNKRSEAITQNAPLKTSYQCCHVIVLNIAFIIFKPQLLVAGRETTREN